MKRALASIIFLFIYTPSFSQLRGSNLSLILGYPIPVGHNFVNKDSGNGFTGIADIGLDYTVLKANQFNVGILMNASFLKFKPLDISLNNLSPKVKIGYIVQLKKIVIQPQLAIGYSYFRFTGPVINGSLFNESVGGISAKASTKVILNNERKINYYLSLAYELNRIGKLTTDTPDTNYNRYIQFVTPGAGILWKFGRI